MRDVSKLLIAITQIGKRHHAEHEKCRNKDESIDKGQSTVATTTKFENSSEADKWRAQLLGEKYCHNNFTSSVEQEQIDGKANHRKCKMVGEYHRLLSPKCFQLRCQW